MWVIVSSVLSLFLLFSTCLMQVQFKEQSESSTPFECGMDPLQKSRSFYMMHFFVVVVLFVIFDLELAVLLPLVMSPSSQSYELWYVVMGVLMVGLVLEVFFGNLDWKE